MKHMHNTEVCEVLSHLIVYLFMLTAGAEAGILLAHWTGK